MSGSFDVTPPRPISPNYCLYKSYKHVMCKDFQSDLLAFDVQSASPIIIPKKSIITYTNSNIAAQNSLPTEDNDISNIDSVFDKRLETSTILKNEGVTNQVTLELTDSNNIDSLSYSSLENSNNSWKEVFSPPLIGNQSDDSLSLPNNNNSKISTMIFTNQCIDNLTQEENRLYYSELSRLHGYDMPPKCCSSDSSSSLSFLINDSQKITKSCDHANNSYGTPYVPMPLLVDNETSNTTTDNYAPIVTKRASCEALIFNTNQRYTR